MPQDPGRHRPADISLKALFVAGSLCVLALWWAWPRLQSQQKLHAEIAQLISFEPRPLPDFQLDGIRGPLHVNALKGHWTILYFAYTRCADECLTALGALASLHRQMAAAGQTRSLRFVVISVAADDDALRIQDFASSFDPKFEAYAGSWEEREKLFLFLDADVDVAPEKGPGQYVHSNQLYLIDPEAHYVATWNRMPPRETLQHDLCGFINCPL
ncbi:MAG TPA: SCO family protein [Oligoflexus sp.]|uniref:SCO family protein n=1 Tax=Oligoflexus sp. TaxID=1971216 RepID=UPI002D35EC65|nr:SCO family protein [Oligoflexus sp.]HYX39641.1 SCO family protein [Oligoflexus sp.]